MSILESSEIKLSFSGEVGALFYLWLWEDCHIANLCSSINCTPRLRIKSPTLHKPRCYPDVPYWKKYPCTQAVGSDSQTEALGFILGWYQKKANMPSTQVISVISLFLSMSVVTHLERTYLLGFASAWRVLSSWQSIFCHLASKGGLCPGTSRILATWKPVKSSPPPFFFFWNNTCLALAIPPTCPRCFQQQFVSRGTTAGGSNNLSLRQLEMLQQLSLIPAHNWAPYKTSSVVKQKTVSRECRDCRLTTEMWGHSSFSFSPPFSSL